MSLRWIRVALLMLAAGLFAGCAGDSVDNPFKGSWISPTGDRITFHDSTWFDSDGDAGDYSYTGDSPVFTLTFVTGSRSFPKRATFADANSLELCTLTSGGFVGLCEDLVIDRPTLH